jgi:hypothetical protein
MTRTIFKELSTEQRKQNETFKSFFGRRNTFGSNTHKTISKIKGKKKVKIRSLPRTFCHRQIKEEQTCFKRSLQSIRVHFGKSYEQHMFQVLFDFLGEILGFVHAFLRGDLQSTEEQIFLLS